MSDLKNAERRFRPELEGVRVVAASLVAIYHIWLGSVSGGVDVFFVVSGYLITTSLLSRMENNGRIGLFKYLLGLGKRLFPLAFIILFFTVVFSFLLLPQVQWKQTISEVFASAFYYQNWQLAFNAVDYLAQNNEAGPLQHFWAMSLQGQFYIIWPLIIFLSFTIATKVFKTPIRKTLLTVLSVIFIISITYSVYITTINQPWAYFDTFARVWEFSLGGIVALLIPYVNFNKTISLIIGWIGLLIICFTGILLPVSTVFPGYAALLPITGVILIILSAEENSQYGVKKLIGSKPFLYLGNLSYGFYLWHWPILIFYLAIFQRETVSLWHGLIIILFSLILSLVSTKLIETPIRKLSIKTSKNKIITVLVVFIFLVVGSNTIWNHYFNQSQKAFLENLEITDYPGARVLYENVQAEPDVIPIDTPIGIDSKLPPFYADNCYVKMSETGIKICSYGKIENPKYTIALVGGSHSGHWFPALEQFAEELNLRIDVYNKDACRFSTTDFDGGLSDSCMEWNKEVVKPLKDNPPDLIFTTANVNSQSTIPEGYLEMWKKFDGITHVFAIRDNPRAKDDIPTCVEARGPDECTTKRSDVLSDIKPWENTEGIPENVYFADLSDNFCDDETCYPVIGNVLVLRDKHHISTLYSMTLAEPLKREIENALEWISH